MYTKRDYPVLNELVSEFANEGLVVLGFPTAQFSNQEPGNNDEILKCLANIRPGNGFVPSFPLMEKTLVNGQSEHALWKWVKRLCPLATTFAYGALTWTPITSYDIGWNFEKILVDRAGRPCRRYDSSTPAASLRDDVAATLRVGCPNATDRCTSSNLAVTSGASRR